MSIVVRGTHLMLPSPIIDAEYVSLARLLDPRLVSRDERLRRGAGRLVNVVGPDEVTPPEHPHSTAFDAERERRRAARKFGIGSPVIVRSSSLDGIGSAVTTSASSASSSTRCWVPTRSERSRPSRIQRRMVSGLRPTRRAASGTVKHPCSLLQHPIVRVPARLKPGSSSATRFRLTDSTVTRRRGPSP